MRAPPRGFTLLEVLVALIVISMFLGLLLPGAQMSAQRMQYAMLRSRASLLAKSQLETLYASHSVSPGVTTGNDEDLVWEVTVSNGNETTAQGTGFVLRDIRVKVMMLHETEPLMDVSAKRIYAAQ